MKLYFEKQVSSLCGQHCLNNLLQQGPLFSAMDLAEIAQEMDAHERAVMLQNGSDTPEALKFLAEESGNVDGAGNFSIQVLSEALKRSFGLKLVSIESEEVKGKLKTTGQSRNEGFVCNRHAHWFAIREIDGKYWTLNSTAEKPEPITSFALEATLSQFIADGWNVFVCVGKLPAPSDDGRQSSEGEWLEEGEISGMGGGGGGGAAFGSRAAAAKPHSWDSAGQGQRLDGKSGSSSSSLFNGSSVPAEMMSEEEAMAAAIAMSLSEADAPAGAPVPEEPPAGPGVINLQVKLPGRRVVRRFHKDDQASILFDFVAALLKEGGQGGSHFELLGPGNRPLARQSLSQATFDSADLKGASIMVKL